MQISDQAVIEYKKIYRSHYGIELTDYAAREQATMLLRIFKIICRPIPIKIDMKNYEKK
jgi:hypothetical protein